MEYFVGAALALVVGTTATLIGFDRDRAFYATILIVIASYYVLFAAMSGSAAILAVEGAVLAGFVGIAMIGFRTSLWMVVAGLAAHGTLDIWHGHLIANPGTPSWWSMFCFTYDLAAAGYLSLLLIRRGAGRASATASPARPLISA